MSTVKVKSIVIERRQRRQKDLILEQLRKVPIVQVAVGKVGVSRASFYRWLQVDKRFAADVEKAVEAGVQIMNDMAESQLVSEIRDRNMTAILFWLKNRHPAYTTKVEINSRPLKEVFVLTDEQRAVIRKSMAESRSDIGTTATEVIEAISRAAKDPSPAERPPAEGKEGV